MSLKTLAIFITIILSGTAAYSQNSKSIYTISGATVEKIKKNCYEPLALSKIYVLTGENNVAASVTSIDNGSFLACVPKGKYTVIIENTGHKSVRIGLEIQDEDINLGDIILEIGEELEASRVSAQTLIRRQGYRINYDVSKDPDRYRINMMDMISRIPNVRMSAKNGKLVFNNDSFTRILVDDENNGLINSSRQYPMEFIKAHYMKNIEVVLPGDPEYQNDKPILLIQLAKKLPLGVAAQQAGTATTDNEYETSTDAVANTPIMGVGVQYSYSFDRRPTLSDETYTEFSEGDLGRTESVQSNWSRNKSHNITTNLFKNYFKETVRFNATLKTSYADASSFSESKTRYYDQSNSLLNEETTTRNGLSKTPFRINGSFRLTGAIKSKNRKEYTKKHKWLIEYSYSDKQGERLSDYTTYSQNGMNSEKEHRINTSIELKRIKLKNIIFNTKLENGFYYRDYENSTDYNGGIAYSLKNTGMNYHQSVIYAKFLLLGIAFKKIAFTANLNSDYLSNNGHYLNGETTSPLDYSSFNFCPALSASYSYKKQSFQISYKIIENRPNIKYLNPFEDRSNPSNIWTGNPNLKEQITNSTSVSYTPGLPVSWLTMLFSGGYNNTKDMINGIVQTIDNGTTVHTYCNYGRVKSYVGNANVFITPTKNTNIQLGAFISQTYSSLPSGITNKTKSISTYTSISWSPKVFELNAEFNLNPRDITAQTSKVFWDPWMSVSVSRYFRKPKLGISLYTSDILRSGGLRETLIKDVSFAQKQLHESIGRSLMIKVYWRFGVFQNSEKVDVSAYDMQ